MIDSRDLWKKRSGQYFKEIRRYLRYMLNDHLLIALIFLLGGGAYYYNNWLKEIPENFPYALLIAIVLAVILTNSRIQTMLKEPDLVFLLPVEKRLSPYFQKAFWFSLLFQSYVLILAFAAVAPMYIAATEESFLSLLTLLCIVLLGKAWNLLLAWNVQFSAESSTRQIDIAVRFIMNFVLVYLIFSNASVLFIGSIIGLMIILLLYFQKTTATKGLKWDYLIELESKRMMSFYRLANLFTDVPKLQERVKKRAWLLWVTSFITFAKKNTFGYLYTRTFLRTSDYLGMYIRLTIIGGLILYFVPLQYGKAVISILFLYLTGYQLLTLWRHHSMKIWVQLYPINEDTKLKSFLQLLFMLLIVQSILFTCILVFTMTPTISIAILLSSMLFTYLFVYFYIKDKVKKLA